MVQAGEPCLDCHWKEQPESILAWERSRHGQAGIACARCHGDTHDGTMAAHARANERCIPCHEAESRSYRLSKHGVIVTLEGERLQLSQPLKAGNLRAPTCAYCHLHDNRHGGVPPSERQSPCRDCHSPRLVATWFASGAGTLEIGAMKRREAEAILKQIETRYPDIARTAGDSHRNSMTLHLNNLRLGVGHQSPDDLWWHGQPALDGDLLRIKTLWGDLERTGQTID